MNRALSLATGFVALLFVACEAPAPEADVPDDSGSSLSAAATAYVLQPEEGEVLVPCRVESSADARWTIKVDPAAGSKRVAMGTQDLPGHERIPVHRHEHQDEILFIHEGHATGIVGDERVEVGPGTTVYVPQGVWHGVENHSDAAAKVVWVVVPPGLENFFRDIGVPPGTDCVPMSAEEMEAIRARHGITQRMDP